MPGMNDMLNSILQLSQVDHANQQLQIQKQYLQQSQQQQQAQQLGQFQNMVSQYDDPSKANALADQFSTSSGINRDVLQNVIDNTTPSTEKQRAYATKSGSIAASGGQAAPEFQVPGASMTPVMANTNAGAYSQSMTGENQFQNSMNGLLNSYMPGGAQGSTPLGQSLQSVAVTRGIAGTNPLGLRIDMAGTTVPQAKVDRAAAIPTGDITPEEGVQNAINTYNANTNRISVNTQGNLGLIGAFKGEDIGTLEQRVQVGLNALKGPNSEAMRMSTQSIIQQDMLRTNAALQAAGRPAEFSPEVISSMSAPHNAQPGFGARVMAGGH